VKRNIIITALSASLLAGCGGSSSPIGLVDVDRIVANWPTYQNYQTQLSGDEARIAASKANPRQKQQQVIALERKYGAITEQLTQQIRVAATKVAQEKQLKLVVTRQGVGYGGTDITPDIEKSLNITEKPTPAPST
jgi:Skp family chaperone for outer membrane proteins